MSDQSSTCCLGRKDSGPEDGPNDGVLFNLCSGTFNAGGKYCLSFGGKRADLRLAEEVLRALSPLGLRPSVEAAVELGRGDEVKEKALERQVEQLDYEARRAFEQYNEVDPRNRLVAGELKRRWNEKLNQLETARAELATLVSHRPLVTSEQREELLSLGAPLRGCVEQRRLPRRAEEENHPHHRRGGSGG